jgi:hypothetical protein
LEIAHQTSTSTQGERSLKLRETPCNLQRRLYDYQWALTRTPLACERAHQAFLQLDNTTAPQGLLQEQCTPPSPLEVLGEARGRL